MYVEGRNFDGKTYNLVLEKTKSFVKKPNATAMKLIDGPTIT